MELINEIDVGEQIDEKCEIDIDEEEIEEIQSLNNEDDIRYFDDDGNVICPSCSFLIDTQSSKYTPNQYLCFYCFYRGRVGASRYIVFKAILDAGNEFMSLEEITELTNQKRRELGRKEVKQKAVYDILHRYSMYYEDAKKRRSGYLVLVRKIRSYKGKKGRKKHKYKLSSNLVKRVENQERRWMNGLPLNTVVKKGRKFKLTTEYKRKAKSIRNNIKSGKYEPYKFILP